MTEPILVPGATVLVTGAAGMLGDALVPALLAAGHRVVASDIDLTEPRPWGAAGPALQAVDVRAAAEVDSHVRDVAPRVVMHLAAETSLEACERDPAHAAATNAHGTRHLAEACCRHDTPLVYISTAGVFGGEKSDAYVETDPPDPINWYGRTKADGEDHVRDIVRDHFIVRAGWMVGRPGGKDHKFIGRILGQIRAGQRVVHAVGDKFGSPTYAPDLAATLIAMLTTGAAPGTYHAVSETHRSRYDVATEVVAALGRDDVTVRAVDSTYFAQEFSAPRPRSEVLANARLRAAGRNLMRPWPQPLDEYLRPWQPLVGAQRHEATV